MHKKHVERLLAELTKTKERLRRDPETGPVSDAYAQLAYDVAMETGILTAMTKADRAIGPPSRYPDDPDEETKFMADMVDAVTAVIEKRIRELERESR